MRYLDRDELCAEKGIRFSRTHLHRLVTRGCFPRPVKMGAGISARNTWREDEIDEWLEARAAERFGDEAGYSGEAA